MAKGIYIGVSNTPRKVTNIYFGVGNTPKKVTKAYIGIGGVAKLFYSAYTGPVFLGTAQATTARYGAAGARLGHLMGNQYAVIGGGWANTSWTPLKNIEIWDKNLTQYASADGLKEAVAENAAGSLTTQSVNNTWILFAGGYIDSYSSSSKTTLILYGDTTLPQPANLTLSRGALAAAGSDKYILFAGGSYQFGGLQAMMVADAYNANATKITAGLNHLTAPSAYLAGATLNTGSAQHMIFAGGKQDSGAALNFVTSYNSSLTQSLLDGLSEARYQLSGAAFQNYVLFAGGRKEDDSSCSTVDIYNSSLTRSTGTPLSVARYSLGSASLDDYAIFAGGTTPVRQTIDVYDQFLARTNQTQLSSARHSAAGVGLSDMAIFACGYDGSINAPSSAIDYYGIT